MKRCLRLVLLIALLCGLTAATPSSSDPPDAWHLLVYSLRLLPIEAAAGTPAYDDALAYRLELVTACAEATGDRTERYICTKVARFESNYRRDVGQCELLGKEGERTAWQIIPRSPDEKERLCVTLVEDARVHLERVRESRAACHHLPKQEQLALYARGSCASADGRKLSTHRFPTDAEIKALETQVW